MTDDVGGDPACWTHLFESPDGDPTTAPHAVVDLGATETAGPSGAIWSLPHGADLDANLVHLHPGHAIDDHVNCEVDVIMFVQSGRGELTIDDTLHQLREDMFALIPKGAHRRVCAGPSGITYLSIHRRRGPLTLTGQTDRARHDPIT